MRPSAVKAVIAGLKRAGVSVVCYLPDSLFKELYPALDADPDFRTVRVTNEGEGAAICGGMFLSGKRAALEATSPYLVVAKVEAVLQPGLKRRHSDGCEDKYVFVRHVEATEDVVIMGPSEHN